MTDLTDVNIKELLAKNDDELRAELESMLPKPPHPEHMLGLWATHSEFGQVLCCWDTPDPAGDVRVSGGKMRGEFELVPVSELTFPHQATRPEDVPVGEAWLVNVDNWVNSGKRVVALKFDDDEWGTGEGVVVDSRWWLDAQVTLVAPLTPQPAPEPQPEPEHPRTLSSVEDYETAPAVIDIPDHAEDGPQPDHTLAAAAPDMARMIAGARVEYAVARKADDGVEYLADWGWTDFRSTAEWHWSPPEHEPGPDERIITRLVIDLEEEEE